jgi:hypothetical protein
VRKPVLELLKVIAADTNTRHADWRVKVQGAKKDVPPSMKIDSFMGKVLLIRKAASSSTDFLRISAGHEQLRAPCGPWLQT